MGGKGKCLLLVLFAFIAFQCRVSAKDMVGYWRMDENGWSGAAGEVIDSSGQGNNGVSVNGANTNAYGQLGRCGSFDGSNDYVAVPITEDLSYSGGDFSVSFWMKIDPDETSGGHIISNANSSYNWHVWIDPNTVPLLHACFNSGNGSFEVRSNSFLDRDVWHYVVVTLDGSTKTAKMYINGVLNSTVIHTIDNWNTPALTLPLAIGTFYPYGSGWGGYAPHAFKGLIDDLAVLTRCLSPSEVVTLWNDGLGRVASAVGSGILIEPFYADSVSPADDYPQYDWTANNGTALVSDQRASFTSSGSAPLFKISYGNPFLASGDAAVSADMRYSAGYEMSVFVRGIAWNDWFKVSYYYSGNSIFLYWNTSAGSTGSVNTGFSLPQQPDSLYNLKVKGDGLGNFTATLTDANNPESAFSVNFVHPFVRGIIQTSLGFQGNAAGQTAIIADWKVIPGWRGASDLPDGPVFDQPCEEHVAPETGFPSWINVEEYGADGSDDNDDTAAIQDALDDAGVIGKSVVYLPAGTYKISGTLMMTSRIFVGVIGEDPATTKIKWTGGDGGGATPMLLADGVLWSRFSRITWDGAGRNVIGLAHKYHQTPTNGMGSSANFHSDEVFQDLSVGLAIGSSEPGYGISDDTMNIVRCRFYRCSGAGIRTGSYNAFQNGVWDCVFVDNASGIDDYAGGGACNVYRSYFQNSSVADIHVWTSFWRTLYGNTSVGSKRFFLNDGMAHTGIQTVFQDNLILDSQDDATIYFCELGPVCLLDNRIRSRSGTACPVVVMAVGDGPDLCSINNRYTATSPVLVRGNAASERYWTQDDQVVDETAIGNSAIPSLPGTPAVTTRVIYDLTTGDTEAVIQAAINNAAPHSLVHIPAGVYSISQTLVVPANLDIMLLGDCQGTQLRWTGVGSGPILRLAGPSKATIRDINLHGGGSVGQAGADCLIIDGSDQPGAKIYTEGGPWTKCVDIGLLVNGCSDTVVECHNSGITYWDYDNDFRNVKVVGGEGGAGYTAIFNFNACNSSPDGTVLEVTNGGKLLIRDLDFEGVAPRLVKLTDNSDLTIADGRSTCVGAPENAVRPEIELDGFTGRAVFLDLLLDMSDDAGRYIRIANETEETRALFLGMIGWLPPGQTDYLNRVGSGGIVSFLTGKYHNTSNSAGQVADEGDLLLSDPDTPEFINTMLEQLRAWKPAYPAATGSGVTDVRLLNVFIQGYPPVGVRVED